MGKICLRIPVKDINAMRKILDDLPGYGNLGKDARKPPKLLNAHILKALEKGYTVKELAVAIGGRGQRGHSRARHPLKVLPAKAASAKREPAEAPA